MTNRNQQEIPEFGKSIEPIYATDNASEVSEKMRVFMTRAVAAHEARHPEGEAKPGTIPCMSLSIPCYIRHNTIEDYEAALQQPAVILSALHDECMRLGYGTLGVTAAMFGTDDEDEAFESDCDRATGWRVEVASQSNMRKFFDGDDTDRVSLTRLWLELGVKTHGPIYMAARKQAEEDTDAQRQLQEIMQGGKFRA